MSISVRAFPSITVVRELNDASRFASIELDRQPVPGYSAIQAVMIDAQKTRIPRTSDCRFSVFLIQVGVYFIERLNVAKIARGYFDPDPEHPYGYEAAVPRDPSHWRLDEANVRAHEYSHAMDVVRTVEERVNDEFDQPGVQEQLTLRWPCADEPGVYQRFFHLVQARIRAIGLEEFEDLLRDFQRHDSGSGTESRARRAQILDHEARQDD